MLVASVSAHGVHVYLVLLVVWQASVCGEVIRLV